MTRIQLSRQRGWRMPPDAVKVDRTTKWGNPFPLADDDRPEEERRAEAVQRFRAWHAGEGSDEIPAGARAYSRVWQRENLHRLKGKTLACWCPLGGPCHADVLAEMANAPPADS